MWSVRVWCVYVGVCLCMCDVCVNGAGRGIDTYVKHDMYVSDVCACVCARACVWCVYVMCVWCVQDAEFIHTCSTMCV